jgi:hypothetical protein
VFGVALTFTECALLPCGPLDGSRRVFLWHGVPAGAGRAGGPQTRSGRAQARHLFPRSASGGSAGGVLSSCSLRPASREEAELAQEGDAPAVRQPADESGRDRAEHLRDVTRRDSLGQVVRVGQDCAQLGCHDGDGRAQRLPRDPGGRDFGPAVAAFATPSGCLHPAPLPSSGVILSAGATPIRQPCAS